MRIPLALTAVAAVVALSACGSGSSPSSDDGRLQVTAAFYPLEWAAQRVGGDLVDVTGLTKPGAEPHDLELTPRAVGRLAASDVVVHLGGFQPAVDEAVATEAKDAGFDVAPFADLVPAAADDGHDHAGETAAEHEAHADEAGAMDPHFWLDPVRFEKVATALGQRFAAADPEHAARYEANAAALVDDLRALDTEFRTGLEQCRSHDLVTSHAAFGYLAARYGLSQEGVAGISPDVEPDAAALRDLAAHVRDTGVTTVYSESLVSPALAETVAREAGARVAVLDPLEGITSASKGRDYLEVMRSNLATLRTGQECS